MAKGAGSVRVSKWRPEGASLDKDLYSVNGVRVEYGELPDDKKAAVKAKKKELANTIYEKLKGKSVDQVIDNGEKIKIEFTREGVDHFCNDAMLTLSGKYFSEKSMKRVDEILAKAKYIPTDHGLKKPRKDDRHLWFSYTDAEGRGVYFKVAQHKRTGKYELYSVTDELEKTK